MKKFVSIVLLSLLLLTGCQDLNKPDNPVNKQVQAFVTRYIAALNNNDQQALKQMLSDEFAKNQDIEVYLDQLFSDQNGYTGYRITNIQQAGQTIAANIDLKRETSHTIKLDPEVDQMSEIQLNGTTLEKTTMLFNEQKELLSDQRYAVMEKYDYGAQPPVIYEFHPSTMKAKPGADISYIFTVKKRRQGSMLKILFDGQVISGGVLDNFIYNNSYTIAVPRDIKPGSMFFVEMIVIEGAYDQSNPSALRDISISVKRAGIPIES
jgi:hypothetical protein